jgi:dienelactone hydrolase
LSEGKIGSIVVLLFLSILIANTVVPIKGQAQETVPPPDESGPYQVGYTIIFNISKTPGKDLPLYIIYPAEETGRDTSVEESNAPYPTLFTSTGYSQGPNSFLQFAERVSSHGFAVIVVGSSAYALATERSNDLMTALDWILEQNDNQSFKLSNLVDVSRLAVSGHSTGGAGSVITASKESRFNVCIPMAAALTPKYSEVGPEYAENIQMPILIIVGEDDRGFGDIYQIAHEAYNASNTPKFLITVPNVEHGWMSDYNFERYVIPFLKVYLDGNDAYVTYLYGEHAQQEIDEGKIQLYYDVSEGAPVFELSSLTINPGVVDVGEEVSASIEVANTGEKAGSYTIILKIDEAVEDEKLVTLGPDESVTVSFEVPATEEGTYSVDINGLSGSYDVEKAQTGIPGFPLESIVLSMVLAVLVLWYAQRQR